MGTPFSEIYVGASFRFTDHNMLQLDFSQRFQILRQYLKMAEADFQKTCPYDLSDKNTEEESYNATLDAESVEILSLGVAYYWLKRRLMDSDMIYNSMSTKDYSFFSNANLIREANILRDDIWKEYNQKIIDYSYYHGDFSTMKVGG